MKCIGWTGSADLVITFILCPLQAHYGPNAWRILVHPYHAIPPPWLSVPPVVIPCVVGRLQAHYSHRGAWQGMVADGAATRQPDRQPIHTG